jgi:uncharacterized RDD family membrane protein YckC
VNADPVAPRGRIHVDVVPAEARSLQGRPAGLITRAIANVVDLGIVFAVIAGTYVVWAGLKLLRQGASFTRPTPGFVAAFLFGTFIHVVYFAGAWTVSGRTYGDQLMGLRVVDRNGHTLGFGFALLRAVLCVLFPLGLLWSGVSREHRSLQDLIVRTSVIHDWLYGHERD